MDYINHKLNWLFSEAEAEAVKRTQDQLFDVIVKNKISYAQALEAIERSKIAMQELLLIRR